MSTITLVSRPCASTRIRGLMYDVHQTGHDRYDVSAGTLYSATDLSRRNCVLWLRRHGLSEQEAVTLTTRAGRDA
jgi:hypothetical protein